MKEWWHRICSLILVIAMMVNFLPLNALAEWDQGEDSSLTASNDAEELELQQDEAYESSKIVNEDIDSRTDFSKDFRMDSCVSMAVVYGSPVHYEKDGKWEEIDNRLPTIISAPSYRIKLCLTFSNKRTCISEQIFVLSTSKLCKDLSTGYFC